MSIELRYRIEESLKEKYDEFIIEEFGYKRNRCGSELEKAMKLYLAAKGDEEYQNDPDVLTIFEKAKQTFNQKSNKSESISEKIEDRLDKLEEKLEEKFAQFEKKTRRESSKKHGHAEFKKQFQMAFNDHHQVSKRDLEQFIMNHADIVDKRSIQSRIQYLLSHEILEPFAPNVYNIVF
jgi:transketolase